MVRKASVFPLCINEQKTLRISSNKNKKKTKITRQFASTLLFDRSLTIYPQSTVLKLFRPFVSKHNWTISTGDQDWSRESVRRRGSVGFPVSEETSTLRNKFNRFLFSYMNSWLKIWGVLRHWNWLQKRWNTCCICTSDRHFFIR